MEQIANDGTEPTRHVLIAEQNGSGHRLFYVRLLAEAALQRGDRVTVLLSQNAAAAPESAVHLQMDGGGYGVKRVGALTLEILDDVARDLKVDLVVVPDGDHLAKSLSIKPRWNNPALLRILIMRERSSSANWVGRKFGDFAKGVLLRVVNSIRNVEVVVLKSPLDRLSKGPFVTVADPVTIAATTSSVRQLRDSWKLSTDRYWFAVLGAVTQRKNVALVAASLSRIVDGQVGLLVAGKCSPDVLASAAAALEEFEERGGALVIVDRLLDDVELDSAVAACNSLVLAHSNEGPSGLLSKAAALGTHVVAAGARSLKNDLAAFPQLGVWSELTVDALSVGMRSVMNMENAGQTVSPNADSFTSVLLDPSK
jgi:hypothetical protein